MKKIFCFLVVVLSSSAFSQNVGINASGTAPNASAGLDVDFTNKGVLVPRVALTGATDATTIPSPATSLLVYNTATAGTAPNNVVPGYYYWTGSAWLKLVTADRFSIPFSNNVTVQSPGANLNWFYVGAGSVGIANTAQATSPDRTGVATPNNCYIFCQASSACKLEKVKFIMNDQLVSKTFSLVVYKYSSTADAVNFISGTALTSVGSFTSSATSFGNSVWTLVGNGTQINEGDFIVLMLKNGNNAAGNIYYSGALEFSY